MSSAEKRTIILDLLSLVSSGTAQVTVDGRPLLSIRSEGRAIDLEIRGMKEAGVPLSRVIRSEGGGAVADKATTYRVYTNHFIEHVPSKS